MQRVFLAFAFLVSAVAVSAQATIPLINGRPYVANGYFGTLSGLSNGASLTFGRGTGGVISSSSYVRLGDSATTASVNFGYLQLRSNGSTNPLRLGTYTDTTSSQSWLAFDRAGGSVASPTATTSGMVFGSIVAVGAYGANEPNRHGARIDITATENWVDSNHNGSDLQIYTVPNANAGGGSALLTGHFREGRLDIHPQTDGNASAAWMNVYAGGGQGKKGVRIVDPSAMAAGVGGALVFAGAYTVGGTIADVSAQIEAAKVNSTTGDYGFHLDFFTRANGSSAARVARLTDTGNILIGTTTDIGGSGNLSVGGGRIKLTPASVASLGSAATAGAGTIAYANDLTSTTSGATATGGGSGQHLVSSNGTNWIVQ
jgi:hypothetical protein